MPSRLDLYVNICYLVIRCIEQSISMNSRQVAKSVEITSRKEISKLYLTIHPWKSTKTLQRSKLRSCAHMGARY